MSSRNCMPPIDTTPHGGEIMQPPERPFPAPKAPQESHGLVRQLADEDADEPDIGHRPALPDHPELMAVDIEDEEADPVIDSGPGIDDGLKSLEKQRG